MSASVTDRTAKLEAALAELLRLYDWRFELARMEKDGDCPGEMTKLLNQYGREKKAAWAVARNLLREFEPTPEVDAFLKSENCSRDNPVAFDWLVGLARHLELRALRAEKRLFRQQQEQQQARQASCDIRAGDYEAL